MEKNTLKGKTFGQWKVLKKGREEKQKGRGARVYWWCRCSCGAEKEILGYSLKIGDSKSCGCLKGTTREKHGMTKSPEHRLWQAIRRRCYNKKYSFFNDYGGRGITVCEEWKKSFLSFFRDMGKRPNGTSLDRIDNNKGYCKENCRWATKTEQANNKRSNVIIEYKGKKDTVSNWARTLKISDATLYYRARSGWTTKRVLTQPVQKRRCYVKGNKETEEGKPK